MSEKSRAIIVDIDGTLANVDHRRHYIEKKDWKNFFMHMTGDTVNEWCRDLMDSVWEGMQCTSKPPFEVLLVTGRPGNFRHVTEAWLKANGIHYEQLFTRAEGDYRKDTVVKLEIYEKHIKDKYEIVFAVDDRSSVVQMWREQGITCLQCAEGDF